MKQKQAFSLPVYATDDPSIFSALTGNRELDSNHVRRLTKAIERDPHITKMNPIIVNENMEIIDGQHRLAAHKLIGEKGAGLVPSIYYVVRDGLRLDDARKMNAGSKAWKPIDYARAYAADGNKHYEAYLRLVSRYPTITHHAATLALSGTVRAPGGNSAKDFRDGTFQVLFPKARTHELIDMLLDVDAILQTGPSNSLSIPLISRVFRNPSYSHERMLSQLRKHKTLILSVPQRRSELLAAINAAYNMNQKSRVDLATTYKEGVGEEK